MGEGEQVEEPSHHPSGSGMGAVREKLIVTDIHHSTSACSSTDLILNPLSLRYARRLLIFHVSFRIKVCSDL